MNVADAVGNRLAASLLDVRRRDDAACELLHMARYVRPDGCKEPVPIHGCHVRSVFRGNLRDPSSPFVVLMRSANDPEEGPIPSTHGHLVLFDAWGRIIPVFAGANLLSSNDSVFVYRVDGSMAIAHLIPYGRSGSSWTTQVLHIVPVTAEQKPILNVVVGPPTHGFNEELAWTWRLEDTDGDRVPEVQIGPSDRDSGLHPVAVYRYSEAVLTYTGPMGSLDGDFYKFEAGEPDDVAEAFALAGHR